MHLEIFNSERKKIFSQLAFTKKNKLYLAGGTALALQIGHRTSVDFDFYTIKHFKAGHLLEIFKQNITGFCFKVLRDINDTFEATYGKEVHLSCFYYPYPLLKNFLNYKEINIASLEDIAAMKIIAITQRGSRRDFIDIYYLIRELGLKNILALTSEKYPEFDIYNGLRGLVYFTDADQDSEISRIKILDKKVTWTKIKRYLELKVKQFQSL